MKQEKPSLHDVEKLVAFLPILYAKEITAIKKREKTAREVKSQVFILQHPDYHEKVEEFFQAASDECWMENDYDPHAASQMLENKDLIKTADLYQIKTMLTYCVRGERFCSGHWGAMIEQGHIRRILQRLEILFCSGDFEVIK